MREPVRVILAALIFAQVSFAAVAQEEDLWPGLRAEVFGTTPMMEETGHILLDAPDRAEDAAIVPLTITLSPKAAERAHTLTLIVEQNPSPVAAKFKFGPAMRRGEQRLSTRVRVDRFSFVRAVLETMNGELHMTSRFVKASGGCSAPGSKDPEAALADIGRIKISTRSAAESGAGLGETKIMIKHPNFSGLQMDEVTRAYTPARFLSEVEIREAGASVLGIEGGISLSENPVFSFSYAPHAGSELQITAKDTDGLIFTATHRQNGS